MKKNLDFPCPISIMISCMEYPPIGHRPYSDSEWIEYALYAKTHKPEGAEHAAFMASENIRDVRKRRRMFMLLQNN